jgi:integrase
MILLAYRHGLRASEVCGLTLADVELKTDSLSIQRRKGSRHAIPAIQEHRRQPLLDEITALRAWLKERREDGSNALFTWPRAGT